MEEVAKPEKMTSLFRTIFLYTPFVTLHEFVHPVRSGVFTGKEGTRIHKTHKKLVIINHRITVYGCHSNAADGKDVLQLKPISNITAADLIII